MSFEDKKIKVSAFRFDNKGNMDIPEMIEAARKNCACRLDEIAMENGAVNIGWTSGKVDLDNALLEENCIVGEYLYLTMRIATRKIPSTIAKALLRKKIAEYMKVNQLSYVNAKVRRELKKEVVEQLIRSSAPVMKSIWVVIIPDGKIYAGTCGVGEIDTLVSLIYKTFKFDAAPMLSFSIADNDFDFPVLEFMTDLFRRSEIEDGGFTTFPPYDFVATEEDKLCTRSVSSGMSAAMSCEVRTALTEQKSLSKVKLSVSGDCISGYKPSDCWNFTLLRNLALTGLSLPDGDEMEYDSRFAERIIMLDAVFQWLADQIKDFNSRSVMDNYKEVKAQWIENR